MRKQNGLLISLKVCRESIRKWTGDARILAIIFLVFLFSWIRIEPLRPMLEMHGLSISCWYFPFQLGDIHALFYYFGLILLFCDAPFVDNQQMDVILRAGKQNWFIGRIFYIMVSSCLYFLFIYIVGVIEFIPNVGFSIYWEEMMNILSLDKQQGGLIRREIIMSYSPLEACMTQYIVCVLLAIFLGLVIFYFNLAKSKVVGLGIALSLVLMQCLLGMVNLNVSRIIVYFIPMAWTNIGLFKQEAGGVPFTYSVTVLCIGIVVLVALIMRKSKFYSIECQEDM